MELNHEQIAKIFKALCDENRVAIIKYLQSGEKCACEIAEELDLAQSKLSYHMKILCASGLVENNPNGKWAHYQISSEGADLAFAILTELTTVNCDAQASTRCRGKGCA